MKMKRGTKIGLGVAGVLAALGIGYVVIRAQKPGAFTCPYCSASFDTYEELTEHIQSQHPGQRIPLPIEWE